MRSFNTEGQCIPGLHYMVNIDARLAIIRNWIEQQKYLYIQKGRQYGKTTTLMALEDYIKDDYIVLSLDFQSLGAADFENEHTFSAAFAASIEDYILEQPSYIQGLDTEIIHGLNQQAHKPDFNLSSLFRTLRHLCIKSGRPIVLLIDEVDSAANNQVFIDFLSQLRLGYIRRNKVKTFQSVILAGVYDIKNLKKKLRPEEEHDKMNSPWNIASRFSIDMDFSTEEIAGMLKDYESDHHTGMDIEKVSKLIHDYTSGYPYLSSAICKILDEEAGLFPGFTDGRSPWCPDGVTEAVKILLKRDIPLFGSLTRHLTRFPDLKETLRSLIFRGSQIPFSPQMESVSIGLMFGYLKEKDNLVCIANRIFEMVLQNLFITEQAGNSEAYQTGLRDKNQFIQNGRLNMDLVLEKFVLFYGDIFSDKSQKYVENFGREIFLMYLKPIINGVGNYYQESATRTMTRTDIIVDYLGEQFVIECKIWHGQEYNRRGRKQLMDYLDFYHKKKGYLLSFNFNKNKVPGIKQIQLDDKLIVEAVV